MACSMRGPLFMVAATASFTVMITLVKTARPWGFHTLELMGWRSLVAVPMLLAVSQVWRVERRWLLVLRCMLGASAMFCFYSATAGLGVGELTVLVRLQPIWVALVAPLALGAHERATRSVWIAAALGMLGTGVLTWPKLDAERIELVGVLFALSASLLSALAHTTLRGLKDEDPRAVVFWFQVFVGAAVLVSMLGSGQPPTVPTPVQLPALMGIGGCALAGQLLMTWAYRSAPAATVATAGFVGPLFGFAIDAFAFGLVPDVHAAAGAVLILAGAGVLMVRSR